MYGEESIQAAVRQRYGEESRSRDHLGCGPALQAACPAPGERVLDLGCGNGEQALAAAAMVGVKGWVTGLDLTPAMIGEASRRALERGAANARFLCGDMARIPLPEGSVDLVMSDCAINHAPDKTAVFREAWRVLKKGGRLVISDVMSREPLPPEVKEDPGVWASCFGGAVTEDEYLAALHRAGFGRVEVLHRREYLKNGYPFVSLTLRSYKRAEVKDHASGNQATP